MDIVQGTLSSLQLTCSEPRLTIPEYGLHALNALHTAEPYTRPVFRFLNTVRSQSTPILLPYLNRAASLAQESPAIVSLGVLLLVLVIAMQIINFIRRIMMYWMRLVFRLVFWVGFGLLVAVVWQRGVGRSLGDVVGWGEELRTVWWREYRRWEGYQNQKGTNTGFGASGRGNAGSAWR